MAKYSAVKATVNAYIKQNGRKEITGRILNAVLNATIDSLGKYFQFAGGALPTDDPGTPDQNVCYLAGEPGVYTNFGGITIENEEVALLFWDGEWTKQRILIGIREVNASVDNQVGTPSVDVSYSGGELVLTFHNLKGEQGLQGEAAGFGTIEADVTGGVGTPGVSVETSGDNTEKNIMFHFTNLKGETGVTSVVATIDNTSGNPSCQVSLVNGVLTLAFSGLKGLKGDTGVSADYPITIYNGLDSDATDQALSAAQGKVLDGKVSQLGQKLTYDAVLKSAGKNLFDVASLFKNKAINQNTGELKDQSGLYVSYYIPVQPSTTYVFTRYDATTKPGGSNYYGYYDANKAFISAEIPVGTSFTTPAGCYFVRIPTYFNTEAKKQQMEVGSVRTNYEKYNPIGGYLVDTISDLDARMAQVETNVDGEIALVKNKMKYSEFVGDEDKLYIEKQFDLNPASWNGRRCSVSQDGDGLRITCNPNGNSSVLAVLNFTDSPLNLSHSQIGIDLIVNEGTIGTMNSYEKIDYIEVALCSEDSIIETTNTDYFTCVVNANYIMYPGEYKVSVPLSVVRGNTQSTINLSSVKWVGIRIKLLDYANNPNPSITINGLFAYTKPKRKQLIFGFDGASEEQLVPMAYLNDNGLVGTVFAGTNRIGLAGFMTLSDLTALHDGGNLIGIYTSRDSSPGYWYQMTQAQKEETIKNHARWLYENGLGDGAKCVSVTGGGYTEEDNDFYTSGLVTCITGRNSPGMIAAPVGYYGPYMHGHSVGPSGSVDLHKLAIDALIEDGGFVIFIFHKCIGAADDITLAQFKEIVDYAVAKVNAGLIEITTADRIRKYTISNPPTI